MGHDSAGARGVKCGPKVILPPVANMRDFGFRALLARKVDF